MTHFLGSLFLRLGGWRVSGTVPEGPAVFAIAPHTSNWDFVWLFFARWELRLFPRFLGKHTLFRGPLGWFMYRIGGIPVDRSRPGGVVGQAADAFRLEPELRLALAPEGTRRLTSYWKSGFYEIAQAAGVPVVPVSIDHGSRIVTIGGPIEVSGKRHSDMEELREFFRDVRGRNPENQGPVRLKDEG